MNKCIFRIEILDHNKLKMLSAQHVHPEDLKENARIQRARMYEEERKARIFNARTRLIGVDAEALKKQITEKKAEEEEEKAIEQAFVEKQKLDTEILCELDRRLEEKRRSLKEDINKFREVYQRKEDRREYDLYDPDGLKHSLPCRLHDEDPRLSISSAQKFEGEDLNYEDRKKVQAEQQRAWLEQQITERHRADDDRRKAEAAYQEALIARDARAVELERLERCCSQKLDEAILRFNQALAAEQATQKRMQEMRDIEDKQAEIYNAITSDFLTENPNVAASSLGANRKNAALYKGMSPEEKEEIRQYNLKQIEESKLQKQEEAKREADWLAIANGIAKSIAQADREITKKQRELDKELKEQNRRLSEEQRKQRDYLENIVYTNKPTAAYFEQFNTTTR